MDRIAVEMLMTGGDGAQHNVKGGQREHYPCMGCDEPVR
jgi:hypothetical protein